MKPPTPFAKMRARRPTSREELLRKIDRIEADLDAEWHARANLPAPPRLPRRWRWPWSNNT